MSHFRVTASGAALVLLLVALGCRPSMPGTAAPATSVAGDDGRPEPYVVGVYTGTLPCADCVGIATRLTLSAVSEKLTGEGSFVLSEEYLGTRDGNRSFERRGRWTLLRGTEKDLDATVYQLLSGDTPGSERYFLRVGDSALRLLDRQQREIPSTANHTLTREGP